MSPVFRLNQNHFALVVCVIVVALLNYFQAASRRQHSPNSQPSVEYTQNRSEQIQREALGLVVGGAIGIDEERGDSVYVYVKPR